ncbi:MAG: GNAT family N-acetyltransferase [Chitinophagaceae bacterium]|nr:GNAT family N-acetyltransferase [Chitinophagaceae bacterium]
MLYMIDISVKKLLFGDPELAKAFDIRKKVFVDEQNCPAEIEYQNDDVSVHFLATCNGEPCGAARWRRTENGIKLERFAVLPLFRKKGVGAHLVKAVLVDLPPDATHVYLNAQLSAVGFYLPFGFRPVGQQFEEAGIKHQQMLFAGRSRTSMPPAS